MTEQRIIELEIKVAYQEDLLQDLNEIVIQQGQQILMLERTCQLLYQRISTLHLAGDEVTEPPPPHY